MGFIKKTVCSILAFVMIFTVTLFDGNDDSFKADAVGKNYCIEATPLLSEKVYQYLDEIYVEKYPDFALDFPFGSEKDKNILKALADKITNSLTDDKKKADAIVEWVNENIDYRSYRTGEAEYFAIDVYYAKKANCLGVSQMILNLCRLSGIKAVMCCGSRGDMEEVLTLDSRESDHAWTMIYLNGKWHLYDPLFGVYGTTDKSFVDKWYFFDLIEGVSPYVEKYTKNIYNGTGIFYVDGRFMYYAEGVPASQLYGCGAEWLGSVNGLPFMSKTKFTGPTGNDGFEYTVNPERKDSMINDECYSDGWFTYGPSIYYANPNGILKGCTMKEYNGQCLYLPFGSSALIMNGKSTDYSFTRGYPTIYVGDKINVTPYWAEDQIKEGKILVWESLTPETVTVNADGVITAVSEGFATVLVCSKETVDGDTHWMSNFVEFYVATEERTVNYDENNKKPVEEESDTEEKVKDEKIRIKKPAKVKLKKLTAKKNRKVLVAWEAVKNVKGYEVSFSTTKKFSGKTRKTKIVKKGKTTKITLKKLKKGNKYYIKIRAYKMINNKKIYGKYSKVKTVKVK